MVSQAEADARDELEARRESRSREALEARSDGARRPASAREEHLEQLTFECLERIESEGPAVLEELCRAHPALAAELLERIHALVQRGLVDVDASALIAQEHADQRPPPLAAEPSRPDDGTSSDAPRAR